jgi:hypothetical protein
MKNDNDLQKILSILMEDRNREKATLAALFDGLPIIVKIGTPIIVIIFFIHNNIPTMNQINDINVQIKVIKEGFASVNQYKDQQKQLDEIKDTLAKSYGSLTEKMDKNNKELKEYTDKSTQRVETVLAEVKESNRTIVADMKDYLKVAIEQQRKR